MTKITDRLWKKAADNKIPLTGAFELLPACNLKCKMCYVRLDMKEVQRRGGLLPAEMWIDYAKQAKQEGLLFPLLTGGEPFLRQDFQDIYSGIYELGMQVSINSNGTLISEEIARWLGAHAPTRINITLYGSSEETYEKLCGNGDAYRRVRNAVEWLKKYEVPVKFNTSITPENIGDMEDMMAYARSVNSPIQVAAYMFPPVRKDAQMIGQNHRLSPKEAALARVKADYLQQDAGWFAGQAERFSRFVPVTDEMLKMQGESPSRGMSCRAGNSSFWLDWQGNLGNCGMYTTYNISLKENSFRDAWKKVTEETAKIRFSPFCTNCPNFHICHSCVAMVYNECGDVNGRPEYLCEMNQASAEYYKEFAQKITNKREKE